MIYAGIGSRSTPEHVLDLFRSVGELMGGRGHVLRSGHAEGADMAFEIGCDKSNGLKEIYLPWKGFNGSDSKLIVESERAFEIAESFHPAWRRLSQGARKLQARNSHQVLGLDLNTPANLVICWTEGGKLTGGTAQALRMATHYNIPIINIGAGMTLEHFFKEINGFIE